MTGYTGQAGDEAENAQHSQQQREYQKSVSDARNQYRSRLQEYPYAGFGMLQAEAESIANEALNDAYVVRLELMKGYLMVSMENCMKDKCRFLAYNLNP